MSTAPNQPQKAQPTLSKRVPHAYPPAELSITTLKQLDPAPVELGPQMKILADDLNGNLEDAANLLVQGSMNFMLFVVILFMSGYIIGVWPAGFHYWFTIQFVCVMPFRILAYYKTEKEYLLTDLCYVINLLTLLYIWAFPSSERLFISAYCLSLGHNAIAVIVWRNSLVFHSLDIMTSVIVHITSPVALHCLVHLTSPKILRERFPAIYSIKFSGYTPDRLSATYWMIVQATIIYVTWQLLYYLAITLYCHKKITAGRDTAFTMLKRAYAKTRTGQVVQSFPEGFQEPAFMLMHYCYTVLVVIPCPLWLSSKISSASFLVIVFGWTVWKGATYYRDVLGKLLQQNLEQARTVVDRRKS